MPTNDSDTASPRPTEEQFRTILKDLVTGMRGIGRAASTKIINYYAPKFAQLATLSPSDAKRGVEELRINVAAVADVAGIRATTDVAKFIRRSLEFGLKVAASYIIPIP